MHEDLAAAQFSRSPSKLQPPAHFLVSAFFVVLLLDCLNQRQVGFQTVIFLLWEKRTVLRRLEEFADPFVLVEAFFFFVGCVPRNQRQAIRGAGGGGGA